jgi:putative membrane protein
MKQKALLGTFLAATLLSACNGDGNSSNGSTDTTVSTTSTTVDNPTVNDTAGSTAATPAYANTPLTGQDSTFVLEAASGGMMEVELGNIAQQNAQSDRVKAFGAMMVRDHSQANQELKALASAKGFMLPDSIAKKHRTHVDAMRKMTGKSFDQHYMSMMVKDHNEDITKFERTSTNAADNDLKNFAAKTLPVLRTHKDSATAINKSKL